MSRDNIIENEFKCESRAVVRMPIIVWILFLSTILAFFEGSFLGFRFTGWAWVVPLFAALLIVFSNFQNIRFPVMIWAPWILLITVYLILSGMSSYQRSIQLICPIVIGSALSTLSIEEEHIKRFLSLCKVFSVALVIIVIFKIRILITGELPRTTGLAPQVMTVTLLCVIYSAGYSLGIRTHLKWWSVMAAIPVVALTRTAIAVAGLTLPFTLSPMKIRKRLTLLFCICAIGIALFYTPRFQHKMFQQGKGEMSDILDKNFADSGRFFMWQEFDRQIKRKPLLGHGSGAGERYARAITAGTSGYPHNDWRLTLYDFGVLGALVYIICMSMATIHAYRKSKMSEGGVRHLFVAGASSFIPFALLMYTDNIMVYISFYGNLQFAILGLAYAATRDAEPERKSSFRIMW